MTDGGLDHEEIDSLMSRQKRADFGGSISESMNSNGSETNGKSFTNQETRVYWYRWYILLLYFVLAAMSCNIWNTWGPIETSARAVFGWNTGTISLLSDWGVIVFVIFVFPSSYVLDVFGLRRTVLFSSFCFTLGTGLRCITSQSTPATCLIHIGQIVVGIGGPVAQAASTALSSIWFPPNQRTTATAVGSVGIYMGLALSFVMGPYIVEDIDKYHATPSHPEYDAIIEKLTHQIMRLMYIHFGISCGLLLLVCFTFPHKPPKPPSPTATMTRIGFKKGFIKLLKNPQFQLVAFAYGLTSGVYAGWCGDLALNLKQSHIDDETSSWLGFWSQIASSLSGITVSLLADRLGALKLLIIMLFIVATAGFLVFSLMCVNVIPKSISLFYVTSVLGGSCINGSVPLFYELAVECSYPVGEGLNTGAMTFSNNVFAIIFLTLPLIPNIGTSWMNWFLVASCVVCLPAMIIFKEHYRRLAIDLVEDKSHDSKNLNCGSSLDYPVIS